MTNAVIECLENHRSIRRYKQQPIPEPTIRAILSAGTRAATAGNLQLYSFLVVDDDDKLAFLSEQIAPSISRPPLIIIALLDLHRLERWFEVNHAAPPVMHRPAYFMLGIWDTLIALQNVVIAAESLGLGTCYWGSILELDMHTHFGTPTHVFPAGMVCIGYPDEDPSPRQRLPLEAVHHRNGYRSFDDDAIKQLYRQRDQVWATLSAERRADLAAQGIRSIPQAVAVQRFSDQETRRRSEGILANLRRAGFGFAP